MISPIQASYTKIIEVTTTDGIQARHEHIHVVLSKLRACPGSKVKEDLLDPLELKATRVHKETQELKVIK